MLPWIIQMSTLSLILIVLIHYLYTFFKTNLTIPKVKDLVNKPQRQYDVLFDTMKESNINTTLPQSMEESSENMKNELKNYLKELSSTREGNKSNNILTVDSLQPLNNFSTSGYSNF